VLGLGPTELIVVLIIVILVFGAKRIPEIGSGLGEGIKNFKKSYRESKSIDITPEQGEELEKKEKKETTV
jgi:sec-independent protein translocase protein TatA